MSIKYYRLAENEIPPEEFCAIRDVGGEPSEYMFYVPEAENAKLRELAQRMWRLERFGCYGCRQECDAESCYASECKEAIEIEQEMSELGIEVPR